MNVVRSRYFFPAIAILILGIMLILDWKYALFTEALPGFDISEAALFALVAFTLMYVISTDNMARTMRQQQSNSVAPVVEIDAHGPGRIEVHFRNIGAGPALNFRCWIEDQRHLHFRNSRAISRRAVGVNQDYVRAFIDTDMPDYILGRESYLRAQYEDVFGQTYESCLMFSENALPELKYGRATEKIVI